MIEHKDFRRAVEASYLVLQRFRELRDKQLQGNAEPARLLEGAPPVGKSSPSLRVTRALMVAECRANAELLVFSEKLPAGFGSWLLPSTDNRPVIVIDKKQLNLWRNAGGLAYHVQLARCILHELGHIELHPHLLTNGTPGKLVESAEPAEEDEAWLFAMTILGLAIGDQSRNFKAANSVDASPAVPF